MPINRPEYNNFIPPGICGELLNYVGDRETAFFNYHRLCSEGPLQEDLEAFLKATNDEMRLLKADKYAEGALFIPDMRDASYFRNAVMRRELTADLDFSRQRDHAAHTLYNYLLGWYFYEKCSTIRDEIHKHIKKRLCLSDNGNITFETNPEDIEFTEEDNHLSIHFGDVWAYASLLHDIGYILEGSLSNLNIAVESERVTRGAAIIHDYFNHRFWRDVDLDFHAARDLVTALKMYVPDFTWREHYEFFGSKKMSALIKIVSREYKNLIWHGLPKTGMRMIDHGVCSGLLGLMFLE